MIGGERRDYKTSVRERHDQTRGYTTTAASNIGDLRKAGDFLRRSAADRELYHFRRAVGQGRIDASVRTAIQLPDNAGCGEESSFLEWSACWNRYQPHHGICGPDGQDRFSVAAHG